MMSDEYRRVSDAEWLLKEAKILTIKEGVDIDVALSAMISTQHNRSLLLILDVLKEIRDFQDV